MSEERSEQPTARKLRKSREEGRVAKSQELAGILVLLVGVYLLTVSGPALGHSFAQVMRSSYSAIGSQEPGSLTLAFLQHTAGQAMLNIGAAFAPWLAGLMVVGIGANVAQTRGLVQPRLLIPKWERLNPISKAKQMFGMQLLVETVKGIAKQAAIVLVVYLTITSRLNELVNAAELGLGAGVSALADVIFSMAFQAAVVLLIIAAFDYLWQFRRHRKSLMMTKQEVKDEMRSQEGSPEVKSRIRKIQREMAQRRMMEKVPAADAVVVNPTHFAVAIQYDASRMDAPQIIAKGQDELALRIISLARRSGVPVVPNKPLARALYKLPLDSLVPPEFFQAVAQVLAFVYNLEKGIKRSQARA